MDFKQFYLGCLAHASYYIGSENDAAIIDPQRDIQQYLDEADAKGQKIKYVIETHSHADFVSGHLELAKRTGAEIIFGERAQTTFPTRKIKDGDELMVGKIKLKFLETPGHTPEGITILAENTAAPDEPIKMFSGDTLFIGDVGRPDLIGSKGYSAKEMGGMLFDSLHEKLMPLPDETEIYPAHGAGSLCGKSLSNETWSTLGEQKRTNYALKPMSKEEFISIVSNNQLEMPAYFPFSAAQNLKGAIALEEIAKPNEMLSAEVLDFSGVTIDIREREEYGIAHVPNAINIGLGGQFASWAGTLIPIGTPIAIVAENQKQVDEAVMRLARVGIEAVEGFILANNFYGETNTIRQISVEKLSEKLSGEIQLIDVRRTQEFAAGHAPETLNLPLDSLTREIDRLDPDKPTYVICQSGYRSSIATGILENAAIKQIFNVSGGTKAWIDAGFDIEITAEDCPNSK